MSGVRRDWDSDGVMLLREFWYAREQWFYYRTRNCVSARHFEQRMNRAAASIVDVGYITTGPVPSVNEVEAILESGHVILTGPVVVA